LYIFSKYLEQDVYQIFRKEYEKLLAEKDEEIPYFSEELISIDECEPHTLVVFDDCVKIQQQQIIKDYFLRRRHKTICCICLTQSHIKVDRQLIGYNINFLCIFKQRLKYTRDIYDEYVGSDFYIRKN
jgi:hypothetical protein